MLSILINLLLAIHIVVSVLMVLVVLMQRPRNEGLGAAFGGGMTENIFGAQTTNVLARITRWLGGAFFVLTLTLSVLYAKQTRQSNDTEVRRKLMASGPAAIESAGNGSAPVAAPAATPAAPAPPAPAPEAAPGPGAPQATPAPETAPAAAPAATTAPAAAAPPPPAAPANP